MGSPELFQLQAKDFHSRAAEARFSGDRSRASSTSSGYSRCKRLRSMTTGPTISQRKRFSWENLYMSDIVVDDVFSSSMPCIV